MDISIYCTSSITPTNHDLCIVAFPSFSGQTEIAICKHDETNISYGENALFPCLEFKDMESSLHKTIFASRIFGYIGVRIIDTDNIYQEKLFLIQEWRFFTFELIGKVYFAFIYRDTAWLTQIYTDCTHEMFSYIIEGNTFYVKNTLLESVVFFKEIIFQNPKIIITSEEDPKDFTCYIWEDPISPWMIDFLDTLTHLANLEKYIHYKKISEWLYLLKIKGVHSDEIRKFIGFLGLYSCILPEAIPWLSWYLSLEDAGNSTFHLGEKFDVKTWIEYYDPRWHELRIWLLELTYYSHLLKVHIGYLESGIDAIESLGDERIEFQKIHMNMTLADAKKIYPQYKQEHSLLIQLIKNIIS